MMERREISEEKFPLLKNTVFFIVKLKILWMAQQNGNGRELILYNVSIEITPYKDERRIKTGGGERAVEFRDLWGAAAGRNIHAGRVQDRKK